MFVELAGALRCVEPHEDIPLVLSAEETVDRRVVDGVLGCPVCRREYPVSNGTVFFAEGAPSASAGYATSEYEALRAAALLDLQNIRTFAVLTGRWCTLVPDLSDLLQSPLLLVNPVGERPDQRAESVAATIHCSRVFPIAARSAGAVALDEEAASAIGVEAAARLVQTGGRLLAPVGCAVPSVAHLLAEDERHWVAEVTHPVIATISRRAPR